MGQRIHQVEVKIDADRFLDEISVETMIELESGDLKFAAMADAVSRFVWKDGAWLDPAEAMKIVKTFSIRQLKDTLDQLMASAEDEALPPPNGHESDSA